MAALPMDLLVDFSQRPVGIDLQEYAQPPHPNPILNPNPIPNREPRYAKQKMALNQRALQLLDIAKAIGTLEPEPKPQPKPEPEPRPEPEHKPEPEPKPEPQPKP